MFRQAYDWLKAGGSVRGGSATTCNYSQLAAKEGEDRVAGGPRARCLRAGEVPLFDGGGSSCKPNSGQVATSVVGPFIPDLHAYDGLLAEVGT